MVSVFVVVSLTVFSGALPANALSHSAKADPVAQAKTAVAQAKKDASNAAARYSNAYSALAQITDKLADTQSELDSAENSLGTLQVKASTQAKDAYIRASDEGAEKSYEQIVDETRRSQLLATVSQFDDSQRTQFVGMKEDLKAQRDELTELQKNRKDALSSLAEQKKTLDAKLANSAKAEKDLEAKIARDAKARAALAKSKSSSVFTGNGSLTCPVRGSVTFSNDWGQPRSGGRTHKGTDMFAAYGTPNVAITSGTLFSRMKDLVV